VKDWCPTLTRAAAKKRIAGILVISKNENKTVKYPEI